MTCLEKLKKDFPDNFAFYAENDCPSEYNYLPDPEGCRCTCKECWEREIPGSDIEDGVTEEMKKQIIEEARLHNPEIGSEELSESIDALAKQFSDPPKILDSGNRRQFESGAVRDIQEGKGRMDLLPWAAIMEVSKHCENGAKKYGEHNVDRGIPTHSLCDSAARHLAKYLDGWDDEPHLLAAAWNLLWAVQMELKHKEYVDTPWKDENETD